MTPVSALRTVLFLLSALALALPASASAKGAVVELQTVVVGEPGNPSVGVVPFTDAIYDSCADGAEGVPTPLPAPGSGPDCLEIGAVDDPYGIGRLEITVGQWVAFLNTVDPNGKNRLRLFANPQSSADWPEYGQVNRAQGASKGEYYSVASREWADKPYGFASFLSAARFVNSLYNGRLLEVGGVNNSTGVDAKTYKVRLSRKSGNGMYRMKNKKATRSHKRGFVVPSQDEWVKAAYFDPSGGGTFSYWKYPTNPGVFGDGSATAPTQSTLEFSTGDVTNAATQPLATFRETNPAPNWCPPDAQTAADQCSTANPFGINPITYADIYQGSLGSVGQAETLSPWGTFDQGGNAVEWTDTITSPPSGRSGGRVWRRLHGGISNAPAFQMWPSAVGLQPQDNTFYDHTYPWLGFRIGVVGKLTAKG